MNSRFHQGRPAVLLLTAAALAVSCSAPAPSQGAGAEPRVTSSRPAPTTTTAPPTTSSTAPPTSTPSPPAGTVRSPTRKPSAANPLPAADRYPLHTGIVATTFWVGEVFDPNAADGSQVYSTYDGQWETHYGGCDGVTAGGSCQTERRTAADGYFPTAMTPRQNPFYLDLPFDDVNNNAAFQQRDQVIPWAHDPAYAGHVGDQSVSLMKNRWVELSRAGHVCYGQVEDAGPGDYDDATYVFGTGDARPANGKFNGAGLDVSPALTGCLAFSELNGENNEVDWRFVDDAAVPAGPWKKIVTTSGLTE